MADSAPPDMPIKIIFNAKNRVPNAKRTAEPLQEFHLEIPQRVVVVSCNQFELGRLVRPTYVQDPSTSANLRVGWMNNEHELINEAHGPRRFGGPLRHLDLSRRMSVGGRFCGWAKPFRRGRPYPKYRIQASPSTFLESAIRDLKILLHVF
ncbi:hypothetical protein BS17DRAFT_388645 [Gyrodon lividus]|nr:hypothetical protein BS17DRAFT_388645 [Gyrodon lividus]